MGGILLAVGRKNVLFVADGQGIEEIRERTISKTVAWKDLGAVTLVERTKKQRCNSSITFRPGQHLSLQDRAGGELLRLEDLAPPEA